MGAKRILNWEAGLLNVPMKTYFQAFKMASSIYKEALKYAMYFCLRIVHFILYNCYAYKSVTSLNLFVCI